MKKTLSNVPFIYKDGKNYRFSVYEKVYENIDTSKLMFTEHLIYLSIRKEFTFKLFKWRKSYYYYSNICKAISVMLNLKESFSVRELILTKITQAIESINNDKLPNKTHLETVFNEFDGFINVSERDKDKFKRIETINDIIK